MEEEIIDHKLVKVENEKENIKKKTCMIVA